MTRFLTFVASLKTCPFYCALLLSGFNSAQAQDPIAQKDKLFAAWRQRAAAVPDAYFTWTEEVLCPKGVLDYFPTEFIQPSRAPTGPLPPEDTKYQVKCILKMHNDLLWYEREGPEWAFELGSFLQTKYVNVFSGGKSSQQFWERRVDAGGDPADGTWKTGIEMQGRCTPRFATYKTQPLVFWIRGADKADGIKEEEWELSDEPINYQGKSLWVLKSATPDPIKQSYMIDPAKGYAAVGWSEFLHGELVSQLEITYGQDSLLRWAPKSWKMLRYSQRSGGKPKLAEQVMAQVSECTWNPGLSTDQFAFAFPPGTHVTAHPGANGNSDISVYVKTRQGTKTITQQDVRLSHLVTYEQYVIAAMQSEGRGWGLIRVTWTIGLTGGLVVLLCWLFARFRGRSLA